MTSRFSLTIVFLTLLIPLSEGLLPHAARADNRVVIMPYAGFENGGMAFGGNLRDFILPNLGGEIDGGIGDSICQNCRLSETTLTANLVYEIHPFERLSFYVLTGGGAGLFDLSSPESARATLGLFDIGGGVSLNLTRNVALTLDNRWFIPVSGTLPGLSGGSLTVNRIILGLSTAF